MRTAPPLCSASWRFLAFRASRRGAAERVPSVQGWLVAVSDGRRLRQTQRTTAIPARDSGQALWSRRSRTPLSGYRRRDDLARKERLVKLGLVPYDPHTPFRDMRALAQAAEAAGFDSFWLPDHLLSEEE